MSRESIGLTLFSLLQNAADWKTSSRRLQHWSDVMDGMPAMFLAQGNEEPKPSLAKTGGPSQRVIDYKIYIYVRTDQAQVDPPVQQLNGYLDLVGQALRAPGPRPQTLGGLVRWVVPGDVLTTDEGVLGDVAVAIIPLQVCVDESVLSDDTLLPQEITVTRRAASVWYDGHGTPSPGIGFDGDFYLDDDTGSVYHKRGGAWGAPVTVLEGTPGAPGSQWLQGNGDPTTDLGRDGDWYVDHNYTSNYAAWLKSDGDWALMLRLLGPPGPQGPQGDPGPAGSGAVWHIDPEIIPTAMPNYNPPDGGLGSDGDFYVTGSEDGGYGDLHSQGVYAGQLAVFSRSAGSWSISPMMLLPRQILGLSGPTELFVPGPEGTQTLQAFFLIGNNPATDGYQWVVTYDDRQATANIDVSYPAFQLYGTRLDITFTSGAEPRGQFTMHLQCTVTRISTPIVFAMDVTITPV